MREKYSLETIGHLNLRVVAELEFFWAVERIPFTDTFCIEGIERFEENIFSRDIACAEGKAADTVKVAIRQGFCTVTTEEGTVLEVFVVCKGIPAANDICIGFADVKACRPEVRRTARGAAEKVEVCSSSFVVIKGMSIHIATKVCAVLTVVKGKRRLVAELPLRTDTDDISELVEGRDIVTVAVGCLIRMAIVRNGAEVPCSEAEVRPQLMANLNESGFIDSRNRVLHEHDTLDFDEVAYEGTESFAR